jgi:hypothetical protein
MRANPFSPHAAHEAGREAFQRGDPLDAARADYLDWVKDAAGYCGEIPDHLWKPVAAYFNCGWCAEKHNQPLEVRHATD